MRRLFSKKDREGLVLVNFMLRFGFVFLMVGTLIVGSLLVFQTLTPEIMPSINAYQPIVSIAGYGLWAAGALCLILGFRQKKPAYPVMKS